MNTSPAFPLETRPGIGKTRRAEIPGTAVILCHIFLASMALLTLPILSNLGMSARDLIYPLCLLLAGSFAWALWSWRVVAGSLFDIYALFLIAAYLFHGGQAFLEIFGLNYGGQILQGRHTPEALFDTLYLILLGLNSFHLGALVLANRHRKAAPADTAPGRISDQDLRIVGWALLAVALLPALLNLRESLSLRIDTEYANFYQQEKLAGVENWRGALALLLAPGALFLLAGSKRNTVGIVFPGLFLLMISVGWFVVGRRTDAVMPLVGYALVFHHRIRPLPKTLTLLSAFLMLFVVFPLISYVRSDKAEKHTSFEYLQDAYFSMENPAIYMLDQMGFSALMVADTLTLVPRRRPHDLGVTYANAALNVVPNFLNPLNLTRQYGGTPDIWIMKAKYANRAKKSLYYGYSYIAEAYLSFGWFGAPILLAGMGALLARFYFWAATSANPARLATVCTLLVFLPQVSRGHILMLARPLFWYSLLPYALVFLVAAYRRRQAIGPQPQGMELRALQRPVPEGQHGA